MPLTVGVRSVGLPLRTVLKLLVHGTRHPARRARPSAAAQRACARAAACVLSLACSRFALSLGVLDAVALLARDARRLARRRWLLGALVALGGCFASCLILTGGASR